MGATMAGFDEQIVREYFELHGFLVRQLRKYQVHSRAKQGEEEIDLLVYNPACDPHGERAPAFLLFSNELQYVRRALVVVKGWHTARFTPKMLSSSKQLFSFLEKTVLKKAEDLFHLDPAEIEEAGPEGRRGAVLKILVLPGLPTAEPQKSEAIALLQEKGVDGVLSFRSMLADLIGRVEINQNYTKSDLLQILRILKNYDLVKSTQQELFRQ